MTKPYCWERRQNEATTSYAALILFCEMGSHRSYAGLAKRSRTSVSGIRSWASLHSWRQRAVAFDDFCDGVTLTMRIREAAKIGRLEARKVARQTTRIVKQLTSIDPRRM